MSSPTMETSNLCCSTQDERKEDTSTAAIVWKEPDTATATSVATTDPNDDDTDSDDNGPPFSRPVRRSSIKLKTLLADIPVKLGRRSFRALPHPDMDKVRRAATLPAYMNPEDVFRAMSATNHEEDARGADLKVRFQTVSIRRYQQTVGDNPSVSYGPPIGLDWKYQETGDVAVEDYEQQRNGHRRPFTKLGLNYYQRKAIMESQGLSEDEIKSAKRQANKDKFKRAVTKYFLPVQLLEDAAESSVRKMKRAMSRPKSASDLRDV